MLAGFGLRQSIVCTPYYLHKGKKVDINCIFQLLIFCIYISVQKRCITYIYIIYNHIYYMYIYVPWHPLREIEAWSENMLNIF